MIYSIIKGEQNKVKIYASLIVLVFAFLNNVTFTQLSDNWKWLNPSPQGNNLYTVDFADNNTGYAAGNYGTLLKSTNAGQSWSQINSGTQDRIFCLDFHNPSTGFIGGTKLMLKKTTNGGQTWQNIQLPTQGQWDSLYSIMDINVINQNTCYLVGFFQLECKIWKTTDGGNSWSIQGTGGANYLMNLYFINENFGFAYGGPTYSEVVRTTDGGASWQQVSQESYVAYSMCFIDSLSGVYGCADGRIYKTSDGGLNWTFALCPSSLDINSIYFINPTTGFGFGTGSVYVKTTDGGNSWDEFSIGTGSSRIYFDAAMTPSGVINVVGSYGAMIRTTNSGASFVSQPYVSEHSISDIEFINVNTGYAVAGFGEGDILKTTDAGETWVSQVSSYTLPLYGISFPSTETGYLAGSINIKKTTNGGTNWVNVYTSTTNEIFGDIYFIDLNTGYAVGSYGKLLKTTNAGASWTSSTIPNSGTFISSIFFVNSTTGYVCGDDNKALKTTDAGASWVSMNVASSFINLNNVFFTDANTGYISAANGVYKTTDGGSSWFQLGTPAGGYNNVQFRGNYGYAIAADGKIIKSTDAGSSWIIQPTVTDNSLYALFFNSDDFIYAGGVRGTMMKTIPQELLLTPVSGNNTQAPMGYFLNQNYPNPFNPVTTIKFGVVKSGAVKISVYDVTGKLVKELLNSNLNHGSYEVKWDGAAYSSGIYFYSISASEFTETKKMILVK